MLCLLVFFNFSFLSQLWAQTGGLARAEDLEDNHNYSGALVQYQRVVKSKPNSAKAVAGVLRISIQLHKWAAAQKALERYERLKPASPLAAKLATKLYFQQDQTDTALAWAKKYHQRLPGHWEPFHFMAQIYFNSEDLINAREAINSAGFRSQNNPWVLMDKFLLKLRLQGIFDKKLFKRILGLANHPNIFWQLTRAEKFKNKPLRVRTLLKRGLKFYPADPPPLQQRVSEKKYRYALARIMHRTGADSRARDLLSQLKDPLEFKWLNAILLPTKKAQLNKIAEILTRNPDNLIYQWYYSQMAKKREGLRGENRNKIDDYFFRQYQNNRMLNYTEAALSALARSLEMNPVNPQRQFELARFYGWRGWERKQFQTLQRVKVLGLNPPEKIDDYLAGLNVDTPYAKPDPVIPQLKIKLHFPAYWSGPTTGREVLKSMFQQAFFHQPAFRLTESSFVSGDTSSLARQVQSTELDGAIRITVNQWDKELQADLKFFLPQNRIVTGKFYDNSNTKIWRLINFLISRSKNFWPWKGRVFAVDRDGSQINVGRIHGITRGDSFILAGKKMPAEEVYEQYLKLDFPTPIYKARVQRGDQAKIFREENNSQ